MGLSDHFVASAAKVAATGLVAMIAAPRTAAKNEPSKTPVFAIARVAWSENA